MSWKRGNSGPRDPPPLVHVEVRGWEGGSKDDLVSFLHRKSRIRLQNVSVSGPVLSGTVKQQDAGPLVKWSGVRFAGGALRIVTVDDDSMTDNLNGQSANSTIVVLKTFLGSRYNGPALMLDLQNMRADQFLTSNGLFASASTASKMFPALMKVAGEEKLTVESVNLADNALEDVNGITTLAQAFPDLKNLSLANNNISRIRGLEPWRPAHKLANLRELILSGNPITTQAGYKEDIMRMFPKLIMLDGQVVRDASTIDELKLPLPVKQVFFETPEIQSIVTNFLTNYFDLYDRDRTQLLQLYEDSSIFSLSVNSKSPRAMTTSNAGPPSWSAYIPISRNLQMITSTTARANRLAIGPEAIAATFRRLPDTRHDLVQSPFKFAIEAWRTSGVRTADDVGIITSIHGEFSELRKGDSAPQAVRSFDRTFILIEGQAGNMIVASDMLTVRAWAGSDAWKESVAPPVPAAAPVHQPVPQGIPQGLPLGVPQAVPQGVPPELNGLNPEQIMMVQKIMVETRLNAQYARMCAEQAGFNPQQAAVLFEQSKQQLPPNAFM